MLDHQKPSIGRIVHYVSYGTPGGEYPKACRAAIVTQVLPEDPEHKDFVVGLCVMNPTGFFLNPEIEYGEGEETDEDNDLCDHMDYPGGSWHWPARV
jgi:hypothetical protein